MSFCCGGRINRPDPFWLLLVWGGELRGKIIKFFVSWELNSFFCFLLLCFLGNHVLIQSFPILSISHFNLISCTCVEFSEHTHYPSWEHTYWNRASCVIYLRSVLVFVQKVYIQKDIKHVRINQKVKSLNVKLDFPLRRNSKQTKRTKINQWSHTADPSTMSRVMFILGREWILAYQTLVRFSVGRNIFWVPTVEGGLTDQIHSD